MHKTVMLESAADAMSMVLDFCSCHDYPLEINVENAVPLVYLGKRYKIRALLEQADSFVMENMVSIYESSYRLVYFSIASLVPPLIIGSIVKRTSTRPFAAADASFTLFLS